MIQKLNLVERPGYAIKERMCVGWGGVCVCACVCALHGRNENVLYSGEKEGEEGGDLREKAWEEQQRVVSRMLLEVLALYR